LQPDYFAHAGKLPMMGSSWISVAGAVGQRRS